MGADTKIEWCHHTINPIRGCRKISPGCQHCYAERMAKRNPRVLGTWGPNGTRPGSRTETWSEELGRWDRAAAKAGEVRRVFVNSMWDPFEGQPQPGGSEGQGGPRADYLEVLDDLAAVAADVPHLRLLLLTKRPWNAVHWWQHRQARGLAFPRWWVLASVENQETANERIPWLLRLPAEVLGLSMEPLLGAVDLSRCMAPVLPIPVERAPTTWAEWKDRGLWPSWVPTQWRENIEKFWLESWGRGPRAWLRSHTEQRAAPFGLKMTTTRPLGGGDAPVSGRFVHTWNNMCILVDEDGEAHVTSMPRSHLFDPGPAQASYQGVQWVIVGGESGPGARPMHPAWARSVRNQCVEAGVPFFFKQWGEHAPVGDGRGDNVARVGKATAGRSLDGREWSEVPDAR